MRVAYYTSSTTGVGRLVTGMAIGNALKRKGVSCKYTIIHSSPFGHLAENFNTLWVPVETEDDLAPGKWHRSVLYKTLRKLKPDLLIVHHQWFMVHHFIEELPAKRSIFQTRPWTATSGSLSPRAPLPLSRAATIK